MMHFFVPFCVLGFLGSEFRITGKPIDNSDAETMLGAKAFKHCKTVKQ